MSSVEASTSSPYAIGLQDVVTPIKNAACAIGHLAKSAYALDLTLQSVSEFIKLIDLGSKVEAVSRPALSMLKTTCGVLEIARFTHSADYITSGELLKDWKNSKISNLISEVALFVGRGISTLHWLVDQKVFSFDKAAAVAASIGGTAGKKVIEVLKDTKLMNGAFIVGLASYIYADHVAIQKGENVVSHTLSAISCAAYIFAITFELAKLSNPGAFAVIAVTTGAASWLADPKNTQEVKK
ncbi:MAG: hypothetical protein JSR37_00480 [Verrucomicrobia bacterium]|nr:hypothetical protein [Verrucomicrobiota bacterium]MBS0635956.1 hypothetical protein [Verrucomicrobiota bacterium]